ncbi:hypothetical protein J6S46_01840 [Candidatus Saccharibacteria bacterium]|nr:hypothetical protein [Candidatus Saccharibacteria bacterium]
MEKSTKTGQIIIPAGRKPWPHELRVAEILAEAGHKVEFLPEANLKTADILLDEVEFEIKSPKAALSNSLEHSLKKAIKQSPNIIVDISRIKHARANNVRRFLLAQANVRTGIKRLIMITGSGCIIDIFP